MISKDLGLEMWKSPKTKRLKGHIVKNLKASLPMTVFCSNLKGAKNLRLEHWRLSTQATGACVRDEPQDERYRVVKIDEKMRVLESVHNNPAGGHFGINKT